MRVGMLTSWRTQCGIAEYSRTLAEAFQRRSDTDIVILGSRNYDERETDDDDNGLEVHRVFDVELWNRYGHRGFDVDRILELDLDLIHVQYEAVLFQRGPLHAMMAQSGAPTVVTYHDNCIPPDLYWQGFAHAFTHRQGVGPGNPEVIPFPIRKLAPIVRTFGLGRTREDIIRPICERNGWRFESAATSEAQLGGQTWKPWLALHEWLRGADLIVLWYDDNGMAGSSQAARTAIATGRHVIVNDVSWFRDLPVVADGNFLKLQNNPDLLETAMRQAISQGFPTGGLIDKASSDQVVGHHVMRYKELLV